MEIDVKDGQIQIEIYVRDNIKSISDNDRLKHTIEQACKADDKKPVHIHIKDSFIITSSVIGFLIKYIKKDKFPIYLYVYNQELYDMLDDMDLIGLLNIKGASKNPSISQRDKKR